LRDDLTVREGVVHAGVVRVEVRGDEQIDVSRLQAQFGQRARNVVVNRHAGRVIRVLPAAWEAGIDEDVAAVTHLDQVTAERHRERRIKRQIASAKAEQVEAGGVNAGHGEPPAMEISQVLRS
jgi:hypothetical protein